MTNDKNVAHQDAYVYILEIKHPATQESFEPPVLTYLYPPESEIYQNALNKLTHQEEIIKSQCLNSGDLNDKIRLILGEFLAECTYGWENIEWEGETLIFNYDNAKMLFINLPWLQDQVSHYYGSSSNTNIIISNSDQIVNTYKIIYEQCGDIKPHISMKLERDYDARPHQPADLGEGYVQDALSALIKLRFSKKEAEQALDAAREQGAESLEELLRQSLKWLSR